MPSHVDISRLDGFMLDTKRLLSSELVALATPEEGWAALLLWCRAWQQSPPASLPNDDRVLASFARVDMRRWPKVKVMALRGFVECSDGRLYHRVLALDAMRAWEALTKRRDRTQAATEARKKGRDDERNDARDGPRNDQRNVDRDAERNEVPSDARNGTGRDGTVSKLATQLHRLVAVARLRDSPSSPLHAGPISAWIAMGCDFEADILPAFEAVCARANYAPEGKGLGYFHKMVIEHRDKRLASRLPEPTEADRAAAAAHQEMIREAATRAS